MQIFQIKRTLQLLTLLLALPITAYAQETGEQTKTVHLPVDELKLFAEVYSEIKNQYVDPVDDKVLFQAAIDGMIAQLDRHSALLSKEEFEDLKVLSEGRFFGIGIEILAQKEYILVVAPIDDSPAIAAGIQAGDRIIAVDGQRVSKIGVTQAVDNLKGPNGSKIRLRVMRDDSEKTITVTRGRVKTQTAQGRWLEDGYYYLRLATFQDTSDQEVRRLVNEAQSKQDMQGMILDLRNNPGGTLYAATEVSDLFLTAGNIVSIRERGIEAAEVYSANPDDILADAPLVVMINNGSASAAEIVAGALQDNERATIVGSHSFGKGSVQQVHPINNDYAIKLTVAKYFTPSGVSIQDKGIVPDILIRAQEQDSQELSNEELVEQRRQQRALTDIDSEAQQALRILKQLAK